MQSLTHAHASPADFSFVANRFIAFVDAFHESKILHSGENWVLLSKSVKSKKDFEAATTLVEPLGLEKKTWWVVLEGSSKSRWKACTNASKLACLINAGL
jgi:hypothetical protein